MYQNQNELNLVPKWLHEGLFSQRKPVCLLKL
eukprot:UN20284